VPDLPPGAYPVFELHFDSTGSFRSVTPAPGLPEAYAGPVMDAIRANVKPQAAFSSAGWLPVALLARAGPDPRVDQTMPFSVIEEQAELINRSETARLLAALARSIAAERGGEARFPYRMEMRVRIGADGTADSVSVDSSSGDTEVDERARPMVMRMRFRPARINGRPVRVWVTIPVFVMLPDR
jgi:TonB family protein